MSPTTGKEWDGLGILWIMDCIQTQYIDPEGEKPRKFSRELWEKPYRGGLRYVFDFMRFQVMQMIIII